MKKSLILIIAVFFTLPLFISAQNSVDYLEGRLESYYGGRWQELYIGDEFGNDARLRLSDEGYAELLVGDALVSLTQDGSYEVNQLVQGSSSVGARGLDIMKKLTLSTEHEKWQHEATMGVRGAEAITSDVTGMEDAFTYLEAGMKSMDAGSYDEALINFEEGWEYFEDYNCLLFTALCYEILGQKRSYLRNLKDVDAEMLEPEYRGIYMVRMAEMMIRSLDYEGAVDLLGWEELDPYSEEEQQQILYLLGAAHLGIGSDGNARKAFQEAVDMSPSSEMGRRAAEALSTF